MRKLFMIGALVLFVVGLLIGVSCSDDEKSSSSSGPTNIIIFSTAVKYDANLGGRSGADAKCASDANKPAGKSTVHAFISVTSNDCVSNMPYLYNFPANIPIVGTNGVKIADNWADLIDGPSVSFHAAAVLLGDKGTPWWSGTAAGGVLDSDNCGGWTNNSSGVYGRSGDPSATGTSWMSMIGAPGSLQNNLIGIAY